ncbi:MAG: ATP-grasp domain-containing protein [Armatimonadetes bacterium]|nr:ATP-grasp domain-containing protein [Armatimonadota bacterium]
MIEDANSRGAKVAFLKDYDIGFLGGGQLARMSIQAAQRMGLTCISLDPGEITPASGVAPALVGKLADPAQVGLLVGRSRHVTLENEFIPASTIREAFESIRKPLDMLVPNIDALATIQDKLLQRRALEKAGVASPHAMAIPQSGVGVAEELGFPCVLKARFGGYDGKGTRYARSAEEFEGYRDLWGAGGWLAEAYVPFKRELAQMVFLSPHGDGSFPTMVTEQKDHVCDLVYPSDTDATKVAMAAARAVGKIGLFGVEMFEMEDGSVLVNELAPRPHNSGHYTLDWGGVSQFEQHVRLVMGLPPATDAGDDCCMANLLGQPGAGDHRTGLRAALEDPSVFVHWYGKAESRPGRKMGHLNAVGDNCVARAKAARERFYAAWTRTQNDRHPLE